MSIKRKTSSEYLAAHQAQARKAFENHVIRSREPGRWVVQAPYLDEKGGWNSNFWIEVVVLMGGKLLVHGDIDHVMFAHYGQFDDPERVLRWMGGTTDLGYYVHQKACIGMGGRGGADKCLDSLSEGVWLDHALDRIEDEMGGEKLDPTTFDDEGEWIDALPIGDWFRNLLREVMVENRDLEEVTQDTRHMSSDAYEAGVFEWGRVPSTRLIYAHEALRRLVALLDAEKSKEDTSVGP